MAAPVQTGAETHTYAAGHTNGHSDTQQRPLSGRGHNDGILQERSWDRSHRQDRHREKERFFLSSPLLLLPTSSPTTLDSVPHDHQQILDSSSTKNFFYFFGFVFVVVCADGADMIK